MLHRWTSHHTDDNVTIAKALLDALPEARVFGFWGNLGAGKTTFIKALCAALGVEEAVTSPTFNLVNTYEGDPGEIHHFDFYRIEKEVEAWEIGVADYLDSGDYCFIEWPERIPGLFPDDMVIVEITSKGETKRQIEVKEFIP
ncbi:MAG: tRNA (adenosine(37)-N6)-threonylcarbamoyltransferase complex ATPase subunit type 1 TsaE [Bacteroidia bacterium]